MTEGSLISVLGSVLPDLFALFVVWLQSKSSSQPSVREVVYGAIPLKDDAQRVTATNNLMNQFDERQFFSFSFFVPAFVVITSYISAIISADSPMILLFILFAIVLLIAVDTHRSFFVHRQNILVARRLHRIAVILFVVLSVLGKNLNTFLRWLEKLY